MIWAIGSATGVSVFMRAVEMFMSLTYRSGWARRGLARAPDLQKISTFENNDKSGNMYICGFSFICVVAASRVSQGNTTLPMLWLDKEEMKMTIFFTKTDRYKPV
jgi:hypothetical protein